MNEKFKQRFAMTEIVQIPVCTYPGLMFKHA